MAVTHEVIHAHNQKFQRILDMRGTYNSYTATVYCCIEPHSLLYLVQSFIGITKSSVINIP